MVTWYMLSAILIVFESLIVTAALSVREDLPWYAVGAIVIVGLVVGIVISEASSRFSQWILRFGKREKLIPLVLALYFISVFPGIIIAALASSTVVRFMAPLFK